MLIETAKVKIGEWFPHTKENDLSAKLATYESIKNADDTEEFINRYKRALFG